MMRVLHVIESLGGGGIETTFLNVLRAWRREPAWAAHDVLALAGGTLEEPYRAAARSVRIATARRDLERIALEPHDVVYFLFDRCAYRLLPFVVAHTTSAVVYGKGYDMGGRFRTNDGLAWQPDESMLWGADVATFTTDGLAAVYDAPPGRGYTLGKAASIERFLSLEPPSASTPPRIVCVANLHALKRLGDLMAAVARVRRTVPGVSVRFVGADTTGEGDRLRGVARDAGVADSCEIVGFHPDVADDVAAARVFALPSGCEGVPTAMIEAMAAARPVVVTDVGHIRSVVRDGVEGFLVAPGDVEALADRLGALLIDLSFARKMGLAARARASVHDVRTIASRLRAVLERAADADRRGAA
jgi:glycosyltransferase involved in cell wall biosynthesis